MNANKSNPFFVDDDGDEEFLRGSRLPSGGQFGTNNYDERRRQLLTQIEDSETRQLESTQRSLASICDSEKMGIATAEELLHQGEQLDNIERRTDDMTAKMTASQKHLNNIKSVFGGFKNWWNRGASEKPASSTPTDVPSPRNRQLKETVDRVGQEPPSQQQGEEYDLYDGRPNDLDSKFLAGSRVTEVQKSEQIRKVTNSQHEGKLNENLDMMSTGLSRLKCLAMDLGNEIEDQNVQLGHINDKVDRVDTLVLDQNKQMRAILRK